MSYCVFSFYLVANILTFVLYGADKLRSIKGQWRIPERTLMFFTVFGPFGAFLGMNILRHKTKHSSFVLLVTVMMALHLYLLSKIFISR